MLFSKRVKYNYGMPFGQILGLSQSRSLQPLFAYNYDNIQDCICQKKL